MLCVSAVCYMTLCEGKLLIWSSKYYGITYRSCKHIISRKMLTQKYKFGNSFGSLWDWFGDKVFGGRFSETTMVLYFQTVTLITDTSFVHYKLCITRYQLSLYNVYTCNSYWSHDCLYWHYIKGMKQEKYSNSIRKKKKTVWCTRAPMYAGPKELKK